MPRNNRAQPDERIRQQKAVELRLSGQTYGEIAEQLGYADHSGAFRAVSSELRRVEHEQVAELRSVEGARLDQLLSVVWPQAVAGDGPSIDRAARLIAQRCKLFGLDSPQRVALESGVSDAEFAMIAAALLRSTGRGVPPYLEAREQAALSAGVPLPVELRSAE